MAREYWEYLHLDQLLQLQDGYGDGVGADELHFIVVHQSFELWFKLMITELRLARDFLARPNVEDRDLRHVVHHMGRVVEIMKLLVSQFDVMETLTPQDFLEFRDKFAAGASGLQSHQMRVIEILLGLSTETRRRMAGRYARPGEPFRDPVEEILRQTVDGAPGSPAAFVGAELRRVIDETSIHAALRRWLLRTPIDRTGADGWIPEAPEADARAVAYAERYLAAMARHLGENPYDDDARRAAAVQAARAWLLGADPETRRVRTALLFIESHRDLALLSWARLLLDHVVAVEEQLLLWRMRHARMVERLIGRRIGTGGTPAEYLDTTLHYRIFSDLWDVRQFILPKRHVPALADANFYEHLDFKYPAQA